MIRWFRRSILRVVTWDEIKRDVVQELSRDSKFKIGNEVELEWEGHKYLGTIRAAYRYMYIVAFYPDQELGPPLLESRHENELKLATR